MEEVTKEIAELTKKVMSEPPGENHNLMRNYLDDLRRSLDDLRQDKARLLKDLGSEPGLLIFLLLVVGCRLLVVGCWLGWPWVGAWKYVKLFLHCQPQKVSLNQNHGWFVFLCFWLVSCG